MKSDEDFLTGTVEEFLAALPPDEVVEHSRNVVRNYVDSNSINFGDLKWVEFDSNGSAARGGISSAESMSTRLIGDWENNADIREIIEYSQAHTIRVGALIPVSTGENCFWCIPYRPAQNSLKAENRIRAILLNEPLLSQILDLFNQDAGLTVSEKRVIFQILIGHNLPEASRQDRVSVETKRSQLKSATTKLECNGQSSLMRLIVSQLIHLLYVCEEETSHMEMTESFTSRYFGGTSRLMAQRLSNGHLMRFWEFGPRNGYPILAMHGYLFPFLVLYSERELEKHNIRLILPLRGGFLDSQSAKSVITVETLAEENLELFSETTDSKPISILGHNMGAIYAMILATRQPARFRHVIGASVCLMQEQKNKPASVATKFMDGMRKLATESDIYEIAVRQFQKAVLMNNQVSKIVLRRIFKNSMHDLTVINGTKDKKSAFEWFREIAVNSVLGASSDLALISRDLEKTLNKVPIPIHFIHGPEDPYTNVDELHELAAFSSDAQCQLLTAGGHYAAASHPKEFWSMVSDVINEQSAKAQT